MESLTDTHLDFEHSFYVHCKAIEFFRGQELSSDERAHLQKLLLADDASEDSVWSYTEQLLDDSVPLVPPPDSWLH